MQNLKLCWGRQAGQLKGSIAGAMAASMKRGGVGALYWGYAPFLFKALPYDTTELFTYSTLREHRHHLPLLRHLSENASDLLLGAPPEPLPCLLALRHITGSRVCWSLAVAEGLKLTLFTHRQPLLRHLSAYGAATGAFGLPAGLRTMLLTSRMTTTGSVRASRALSTTTCSCCVACTGYSSHTQMSQRGRQPGSAW